MRFFGPRVAASTATLLAVLGLTAGSASADRWVQTVYGEPAVYVPSTYVPTTSWVSTGATVYAPSSFSYVPTGYSYVPTSYSYVLPASYATTAYTTLPTSYSYAAPQYVATTYYRRPGLLRRMFNRPVIETTRTYAYDAYPTTAYLPTTIAYEAPLATATSLVSACVETTIPFVPPTNPNGADNTNGMTSNPSNNGEPTYNDKATTKANPAKKADTSKPADDAGSLAAPPDDPPKAPTDTHKVFRPQYKEVQARDGISSLPMLRGEVVSGLDGVPKANLEVVFTDLKGTFVDKKKKTDAKGAFEVSLPNGNWSVSVIDPASGKSKECIRVTVTAGSVFDEDDRPLFGLRINN